MSILILFPPYILADETRNPPVFVWLFLQVSLHGWIDLWELHPKDASVVSGRRLHSIWEVEQLRAATFQCSDRREIISIHTILESSVATPLRTGPHCKCIDAIVQSLNRSTFCSSVRIASRNSAHDDEWVGCAWNCKHGSSPVVEGCLGNMHAIIALQRPNRSR